MAPQQIVAAVTVEIPGFGNLPAGVDGRAKIAEVGREPAIGGSQPIGHQPAAVPEQHVAETVTIEVVSRVANALEQRDLHPAPGRRRGDQLPGEIGKGQPAGEGQRRSVQRNAESCQAGVADDDPVACRKIGDDVAIEARGGAAEDVRTRGAGQIVSAAIPSYVGNGSEADTLDARITL